ncbi:MAG: DUF4350 domain-containing protein [Pyrinomonadaceae bacterium]|nr:DUF4350 domain-containing protein [Pyrinomonadaceae bacterium]
MQGRFAIIVTVGLVLILLVALNAASYVEVESPPDSEFEPNRSTFNPGATGTRAFYDLLQETGRRVVKWRDPFTALVNEDLARPSTLVVVGPTRFPVREDEARSILQWVEGGGRLVIIDRQPDYRLLPAKAGWRVSTEMINSPSFDDSFNDTDAMTAGAQAFTPTQPTLLARNVELVQPSRFASRFHVSSEPVSEEQTSEERATAPDDEGSGVGEGEVPSEVNKEEQIDEGGIAPALSSNESPVMEASVAPVIHFADDRGAVLVDYAYGQGRIVVLSDPFIISNTGIGLADNLQLAINIVTGSIVAGRSNLIAFDERHHGYGAAQGRVVNYFAGTPVVAFLIQAAVIILAVLWTRGRRWARPIPVARIGRVSNLEFVSYMAELQQRSRAYDLAIENVYSRVRRQLARYAGTEANAPVALIAERAAARSTVATLDQQELASLMQACEDGIAGALVSAPDALKLVARLRKVEQQLNLQRSRPSHQASVHYLLRKEDKKG